MGNMSNGISKLGWARLNVNVLEGIKSKHVEASQISNSMEETIKSIKCTQLRRGRGKRPS